MTTFILFLIAFVAMGTVGIWGKYIVPTVVIGWHLLMVLFVICFLAFVVIYIASETGKPVDPRYIDLQKHMIQ